MRLPDVVEKAKKSVVKVETKQAFGSGVFVATCMVLTNKHVVGASKRVTLRDSDENTWLSSVIWASDVVDLAVIKSLKRDLPALPLGDFDAVREGEDVVALGHPLGLDFTATRGIISCKFREIDDQIYLQTDTPISPGNSGGPLINENGEIIGINTRVMREGNSLGFAIPIDRAVWEINHALSLGIRRAKGRRSVATSPPDTSTLRYTPPAEFFNDPVPRTGIVHDVLCVPPDVWFALSRWAKEDDLFEARDRRMVYNTGRLIGRQAILTYKQARYALRLLQEAAELGFQHELL